MLMPASRENDGGAFLLAWLVGRIGLRFARINQDTGGLSPLFAINWIWELTGGLISKTK